MRNILFATSFLLSFSPSASSAPFVPPPGVPEFEVTVSDDPAEGFLFLANLRTPPSPPHYIMILDDTGSPVFFRQTAEKVSDFKLQPNGLLTYFDRTEPQTPSHIALDSTYTYTDEWLPGFGYTDLDGHDFQLLPNGHALMLYRDRQTVDMSQIVPGGHPNAVVIGQIIHELDAAKNLVFEWRSWDHFEITDASHIDFTYPTIDYVHANSIEVDDDGNLLLSCRHLEEVTKIDRTTGEIIWRMGGSQNEFTLVGDTQWFSRQHSARRTESGTITLFDNGNFNSPQESRAVEYEVDEVDKVATLVWEYRNDPALYAWAQGNTQRLPNGNTLISWGMLGLITEVRPDGTKAFEMSFVDPLLRTYTAFRFPWSGVAPEPVLWAEATHEAVTLHFVKFGDPDVVQYHVYGGDAPEPTQLVGSTPDNAFVHADVTSGETLYFRVAAENSQMTESPYSNEVSVTIPPVPTAVSVQAPAVDLVLHQNFPNPFFPSTRFSFELPRPAPVELSVYGVGGDLVRTLERGLLGPGAHEVNWDGTDARGRRVGSGTYFYRLRSGPHSVTKTLTLLR